MPAVVGMTQRPIEYLHLGQTAGVVLLDGRERHERLLAVAVALGQVLLGQHLRVVPAARVCRRVSDACTCLLSRQV